jgi:ABC-type polar amino acid transport system ATPase subunit
MSVVLSATDIWKSFGDREVLRGVSLELASNEVVALIGASGSGKSTLLRCLNLLEPIDDGQILLGGACKSEHGRGLKVAGQHDADCGHGHHCPN